MQLHIYMPPAARRHLANMNILHGDFRSFGDNVTSRTMAAIVPATRGRSSLGGALISRAKVRYFVRTVADLSARRVFDLDFDGCRALGRYVIASVSTRFASRLSHFIRLHPQPAGPLRKQPPAGEDESGPVPSPEEGRGRSFSPRIAQDEFPAYISAGVCR